MAERIFDSMQQNRFGTDYGSVVYWVRRCQSECTLVFLHGLTADHTLFERQVAYFEGRCNIFCWDALAHLGIDTCPFGLDYYAKSDAWWLRQVEWMSLCFPHKLLVKSIAKSCAHTEAACQNMLTALQPYSKKELAISWESVLRDFWKKTVILRSLARLLFSWESMTGQGR